MTIPPFDSIIFDMDGTLWDAVDLYVDAWNNCMESHRMGHSVDKQFLQNLMGVEEKIFLEKVLPGFSNSAKKSLYKEVVRIQYNLIRKSQGLLYNGVAEGLQRLSQHYKLFIVSNCPEHTIHHFIESYDLGHYILDSRSHGETGKSKRENISELIEKHRLLSPVYAGDTESDRLECLHAQIPFIFMEYGFGSCTEFHSKYSSFEQFTTHMLSYCQQ